MFFDQDSDSEYGMDWIDRDDDYNVFEENQIALDREGDDGYDDWSDCIDDDADDREYYEEDYSHFGPDE